MRAEPKSKAVPSASVWGAEGPLPAYVASIAMFLICMDTLITNVALPTIEAELGGGMAAQQWIVDGYTMPLAMLLLCAGNISDRLGAKRVFIAGMAGFAVASLICALANSVPMLVLGRVALGIAGALTLPSSMSLINEAYLVERARSRALAIWGIGGSAATACGPLLGGLLVPIHWGWVFAINVPVCAVVLLMARHLPTSPTRPVPFDMPSQVLAIAGIGGLTCGVIEAGGQGFLAPLPLACMLVGAIGCIAFVARQQHAEHPMMPLTLFESEGMRIALYGGFSMILSWNGMIFLSTLFLQQGLGVSPLMCGLAFAPAAVTSVIGNLLSDRLTGSRGMRFSLSAGMAVLFVGYGMFVVCGGVMSSIAVSAAVCIVGLGGALTTPCLASLVLKSAGAEHGGVASAVFNTLRQVGGALGIAVFGALVAVSPSFQAGMTASLGISVVLILLLFISVRRSGV